MGTITESLKIVILLLPHRYSTSNSDSYVYPGVPSGIREFRPWTPIVEEPRRKRLTDLQSIRCQTHFPKTRKEIWCTFVLYSDRRIDRMSHSYLSHYLIVTDGILVFIFVLVLPNPVSQHRFTWFLLNSFTMGNLEELNTYSVLIISIRPRVWLKGPMNHLEPYSESTTFCLSWLLTDGTLPFPGHEFKQSEVWTAFSF